MKDNHIQNSDSRKYSHRSGICLNINRCLKWKINIVIRWNTHEFTNTHTLILHNPTSSLPWTINILGCNRIPAILWIFHLAHTCNYWFRYNSCQMTFCPILFGSLDKIQLDRPETCRHFVFPENFNRNVFDEKQTMPNFLPRSEVNQTCLWLCISYLYCVIVCFPFFSRSIKLLY